MNNKLKGFTLVELIVVIAILATLGLLLVPQISGYVEESQRVVCMNNLNLVQRSYLTAKTTDEKVSMTAVITNKNGKYFSGKAECPKTHDEYGRQYLDNLWCPYHKMSTLGELTIYDEYVASNMDSLLAKIEKCAEVKDKDKCISELTNGKIINFANARNDTLRAVMKEQYGNTWPAIDNKLASAAGLNSSTQYYFQPYYTDDKTELLFVTTDNNGHGNWATNLIFHQGQWYKLNDSEGKTVSLTNFQKKSAQEIKNELNSSKFTKVNY